MEKVIKGKTLIPEKYGMIFCPRCNGLGKIYGSGRESQVCMLCGGFGAIRKPEAREIAQKNELRKMPNLSFRKT